MTLSQKYRRLRMMIGGNRENYDFQWTFGATPEEQQKITPPNPVIRRILGELDFAIRLSDAQNGQFDGAISEALDLLIRGAEEDGVITKARCMEAEKALAPLQTAAKEYKLILVGHAHIDMNWMWSWHETVAATIATFRTMLRLMDEYPQFTFAQSQASVYRIVDEYAPELKPQILQRIREGRWEVTATNWVETDKNMPSGESLVRHIAETKRYLRDEWGIDVDSLEIDFSPDTFGHSANVPEIDRAGGVKYYYHCRGLDGDQALYRWKGQSGREMLVYREQYWYNSGITPVIGAGLPDISKRCGGFKTGLIVYGVGDHGGGPTRRDIERGLEMQQWPVFPVVKFGTFREFFHEAEAVRDRLPLVEGELNFIFQGCYTTQSRIKLANRAGERALLEAEALGAMASQAGLKPRDGALTDGWRDLLFTHFHDILTGSCVQDSREYAMGLLSKTQAAAQSQASLAMLALSDATDTSGIDFDEDADSQAEGAGVGYGVEGFYSIMPRCERGGGRTRVFTVFNPTAVRKHEPVEITVWDWPGEMRFAGVTDENGDPLPFQMVSGIERYWDHRNFRMVVTADIAPFGYTTVILREDPMPGQYPLAYQPEVRTHHEKANYVLENKLIRAEFSYHTGLLVSLKDANGVEQLKAPGGLCVVDTMRSDSDAWNIGSYLRERPVDHLVSIRGEVWGGLRRGFAAEYSVDNSHVTMHVWIDDGCPMIRFKTEVDWKEAGGESVPVLVYRLPLKETPKDVLCDIPMGSAVRHPSEMDIPALTFAAALKEDGTSLGLITKGKYGYRVNRDGSLIATFINSATSPDPYPERGIHRIDFAVSFLPAGEKAAIETAASFCNPPLYQPALKHAGTLPLHGGLLDTASASTVVSAVIPDADGMTVRLYNAAGAADECVITPAFAVRAASTVDALGRPIGDEIAFDGSAVRLPMPPHAVRSVKIVKA